MEDIIRHLKQLLDSRFDVLTAMKIEFEFFWVVTTCSVVVEQRFRGPCCLHLQGEDGILPHHYTASQPRRPRIFIDVKNSNHTSEW